MSAHLKKKLYELADRHLCVGDVRVIGHFWGLELVKNRKTKEPFDTRAEKFSTNSLKACRCHGPIVFWPTTRSTTGAFFSLSVIESKNC